ncbi:MAG: hypothetical protein PHU70_03675 [Dehalococcoidia bacterium]|nr:hypothetical protein [Dehalococcoidia bacterium]
MIYASLAIGCAGLGILLTLVLLMVCQYFDIDLAQNLWLISLPVVIAVALNIWFIELYDRFKKK